MSADFDKFLKLEKRLFKLIDDPLSEGPTTSRKLIGKKERIRNKMRKLEPKIKGMKDGGLAEAIEKVKAKEMKEGGDPTKELVGGQKKLDKNKDGKISGEDFKLLRAEPMKLGGVVKMGAGGGVCKGMGIARAGGKFKLR
jgi:hypothetical protein